MSKEFLYFKNDTSVYTVCTGPTENGGQAPKYYGSGGSSHIGGSVAEEVRDGRAISFGVYQKVGVVKKMSKPGEEIPFAVGQVVKTIDGRDARIVAIDRKSNDSNCGPVVALVTSPDVGEIVKSFETDGKDAGVAFTSLVKNRSPGSESVEFVPVAN